MFQWSVIYNLGFFKCPLLMVLLYSVLKCTVSQRNSKCGLHSIWHFARTCNEWWLRLVLGGYCKCGIHRNDNLMQQSPPEKQIIHLVKKFIGSTNSTNLSVNWSSRTVSCSDVTLFYSTVTEAIKALRILLQYMHTGSVHFMRSTLQWTKLQHQ